jgi:predicted aspartyl protease
MSRASFLFLLLLLTFLGSLTPTLAQFAAADETLSSSDDGRAIIPAEFSLPSTEVTFLGRRRIAIVDTGFGKGIMFAGAESELQSDAFPMGITKVHGANGAEELHAWKEVPVAIGQLPPTPVCAIRNDSLEQVLEGLEGFCLIGMESLEEKVLCIGRGNQSVKVQKHLPKTLSGTSIPLRQTKYGVRRIPVELPILGEQWAKVDTGSNGALTLDQETIDQCLRNNTIVQTGRVDMVVDVTNKAVQKKYFVLKRCKIGNTTFENVMVSAGDAALVGMQLLRHFDCVFDFSAHRAYLSGHENARINMTFPATGWTLKKTGFTACVIDDVDEQGAARNAGIQPGDVVKAIDGRPEGQYMFWERFDLFAAAGTTVTLTVERDGKTFDLPLHLKHPFPFPPEWPPDPPEFNPDEPNAR